MAMKQVFTPSKFAGIFDVEVPGTEKLEDWGVKVIMSGGKMAMQCGDKPIISGVGLHPGVLALASAGELPAVAKHHVQGVIEAAYKHALSWNKWTAEEPKTEGADKKPIYKDLSGFFVPDDKQKAAPAPMPPTPPPVVVEEKVWPVEEADPAGATKVKLIDATKMYQPVEGTSSGSTYHCIAIAGLLKFAARRKGQDLSIRVEGPVEKFADELVAAGFNDTYLPKGYTSVHFHGVDDMLAQRALGAVLMGTGLEFATPIPHLHEIVGHGE